jgi:uncharacterized membrane protein YGL010W
MCEPDPHLKKKRRRAASIYYVMLTVSTSLVAVVLSHLGYIPLSPIAALVAGAIAGFAFAMFQLSYWRFVGHSIARMKGEEPRPE